MVIYKLVIYHRLTLLAAGSDLRYSLIEGIRASVSQFLYGRTARPHPLRDGLFHNNSF